MVKIASCCEMTPNRVQLNRSIKVTTPSAAALSDGTRRRNSLKREREGLVERGDICGVCVCVCVCVCVRVCAMILF